ncbi:MAG: chemotaxis protein CheB [Thiohalophilus sp.]|uniref:chemotaxis protein CheB n=1 Tax=Thiohalophilus sp. TaxID=3028392 RepID=UPI00287036F5|nr:chemotaxis protein CheB [Thiohalophilus sp.]MDR9436538.1 chemotaxis protein CheB [Thiohalophilus sp.]
MSQSQLQNELRGTRIAIASGSSRHREHLQQIFERTGLQVVLNEPFSEYFIAKLAGNRIDVLLIELDERNERHNQLLEELLESTDIPIIFNDVSALAFNEPARQGKWFGTLMGKIAEITGHLEWETPDIDLGSFTVNETLLARDNSLASEVWVLGASLGGPDALKRFLAELPSNLPASLIVAQHLGSNFEPLLARQLDCISPLQVMPARVGHTLRHGEVIVAPVNQRLQISPIGVIQLLPLAGPSFYTPSIDTLLTDIGARFGANCGAIIFSGMCDDGVLGVRAMHAMGGPIWTQEADSCVISNMPDQVRQAGVSSYTGTPEQLAAKLAEYLTQRQTEYG